MTPTRWPAELPDAELPDHRRVERRLDKTVSWTRPSTLVAIGRGLLGRCPACAQAHLFNGFLRVVTACSNCGAPLGSARADDAPPYITILITGHIVVPLLYMVDRMGQPPIWLMAAIFLPLTFFLALGLLRPVKGGTVGLMLTLNMLKSETDPQ